MTTAERTAVLVLGMHRSGTSVLTHLIGRLGAALPIDPNPAAADNPEGYWEPAGVVYLNDLMLRAADSAWLDTRPLTLPPDVAATFRPRLLAALEHSFGSAKCLVLKDPRICRMVPFYRDLLAEMGARVKVVLALRDPAHVAASLCTRNQISPAYTAHLWAHHLIEAERETRDLPRMIVSYDDLIGDWRKVASRLRAFLPPDLPSVALDSLSGTVRADLRHHDGPHSGLFDDAMTERLRLLRDAIVGSAGDFARIDRLADAFAAAASRAQGPLEAEFRFQRLTSPYDAVKTPDPARERALLAAAFARLHTPR